MKYSKLYSLFLLAGALAAGFSMQAMDNGDGDNTRKRKLESGEEESQSNRQKTTDESVNSDEKMELSEDDFSENHNLVLMSPDSIIPLRQLYVNKIPYIPSTQKYYLKIENYLRNGHDLNALFAANGGEQHFIGDLVDDHALVSYSLIQALKDRGFDVDSTEFMEDAIDEANFYAIRYYLEHCNDDINLKSKFNGTTALHKAVLEGNEWMVKWLIKHGADINLKDANEVTPLAHSIYYYLMFKKLYVPDLNLNIGYKRTDRAEESIDIMKYLITHGAHINETLPHEFNNYEYTFMADDDLDNRDDEIMQEHVVGYTPLMAAARKDDVDLAKFLVLYGALDITRTMSDFEKAILFNASHNKAKKYIKLAYDYMCNTLESDLRTILQGLNFEERQNMLETVLTTENNRKDLEAFNNFDPKTYSWEYMLALTEQLNSYEPFLMAKIGAYPNDETKKNIQEICGDAQANKKTNFGRAVRDFKLGIVSLNLVFPQEVSHKIIELLE